MRGNYETEVGNDKEPTLSYINIIILLLRSSVSIKVTRSRNKEEQTFTFSYVSYEGVLNEIKKLQTAKTI